MKRLYAALLGLGVVGAPLAGQQVQVQTKSAPHEEEHIALTQQYRMMCTFARRIEMASAGEEEDARTNAEKLVTAVENAAAGLDALAKVTDSTQVAQIEEIRKYQAVAQSNVELLKAEVVKSPMQLRLAKTHAAAVREAAEKAEDAHAKMLPKAEPPKANP